MPSINIQKLVSIDMYGLVTSVFHNSLFVKKKKRKKYLLQIMWMESVFPWEVDKI